jgi:hypothetical protein
MGALSGTRALRRSAGGIFPSRPRFSKIAGQQETAISVSQLLAGGFHPRVVFRNAVSVSDEVTCTGPHSVLPRGVIANGTSQ